MQINQSHSSHLHSLTPNPHFILADSFDKFQQELNNEILNHQSNQTNYQLSLFTPLTINDIRSQSFEQDNKITQDLAQKLLANLNNPQTTLKIINHIKNHNLKSPSFDYPAIFNKLSFKDKTFSKSLSKMRTNLSTR